MSLVSRPDGSNAIARPRTFLSIVLDGSISMETVKPQTLSAVNEFLDDQRRDRIDELFVTLTTFNTKVRVHYTNVPIADVPPLTAQVYQTTGLTALYDGITQALVNIDRDVGSGDRVLILVVTDGEENSSLEVRSLDDLLAIKRRYEARGNWTFVYLGGMDAAKAFKEGRKMGGQDGNINSYTDVSGAIATVNQSVKAYRQGDDLHTNRFYTPAKRWQKRQWASTPKVVITDE